jgi:hypothetical protein
MFQMLRGTYFLRNRELFFAWSVGPITRKSCLFEARLAITTSKKAVKEASKEASMRAAKNHILRWIKFAASAL